MICGLIFSFKNKTWCLLIRASESLQVMASTVVLSPHKKKAWTKHTETVCLFWDVPNALQEGPFSVWIIAILSFTDLINKPWGWNPSTRGNEMHASRITLISPRLKFAKDSHLELAKTRVFATLASLSVSTWIYTWYIWAGFKKVHFRITQMKPDWPHLPAFQTFHPSPWSLRWGLATSRGFNKNTHDSPLDKGWGMSCFELWKRRMVPNVIQTFAGFFYLGENHLFIYSKKKTQRIKTSIDIRYVYSLGPPLTQAHCRNCDNGINHSVSQSLFRTGSSHSIKVCRINLMCNNYK